MGRLMREHERSSTSSTRAMLRRCSRIACGARAEMQPRTRSQRRSRSPGVDSTTCRQDRLLNLVRAADPLAGSPGSSLTADPDSVLQGMLQRFTPDQRPRRRRAIVVASLAITAFAAAGVAVAKGIDPFGGIGAADRRKGVQDGLEPAVAAWIERHNASVDQINARAGRKATIPRLRPVERPLCQGAAKRPPLLRPQHRHQPLLCARRAA
jgi:hypothetical protein